MDKLKDLINGPDLIVAPCALNPIMAQMAAEAGFKAAYLSGGSLGWYKGVTEAGLSLTEMIQVVVDIRTVTPIPVVLDAGGGWGDPVHVHRTIAMSEAAGVQCIEIEDQLLPRRVEHHIGIDNLVTPELAADRIREAAAARTDPNLVIVGRTNAIRVGGMDDALRRAEMMKKAGADMLFVYGRKPEDMRHFAERLPAPLMTFAPPDGWSTFPISKAEMAKMGYRLAASSGSAFAAMVRAVRQSYECLAQDRLDPFLGAGGAEKEMKAAHKITGLDRLLEIERRTMKGM
ncbi:MAG: isocitrate lyase/PEP mutase family protein [Rhizobiales bacterium]|nr:isocitrate lyase/PEP mutase family protein [Hyphomicrobiales bacterium]